jgi:hypothetical protein
MWFYLTNEKNIDLPRKFDAVYGKVFATVTGRIHKKDL